MSRKKLQSLAVVLLLITGLCLKSKAQRITDPALKNLIKATLSIRDLKPVEKLYIQTDKPYYVTGDTLRLKAYLLNDDHIASSEKSGALYIQLDNANGKMMKKVMLPVPDGLAWGDIALDSAEIPIGNYTLRAYTTWMRNFGEDYIFKKTITISQYENNPLLVSTAFKQVGGKVEGEMKLSLLDGRLQAFKDIDLRVLNGKKNLVKDKLVTGIDGNIRFNFTAADSVDKAGMSIKALVKGHAEFTLPLTLNRPDETDVQFMPEGGALVAGLKAMVGVKAIGEDGRGTDVKGKILNNKGEEIAVFNTLHKGMGRFVFTPKAGETYTAKINGVNKAYNLPPVGLNGTSLAIRSEKDSLKVTLAIAGAIIPGGTYYLVAQSRNQVCFAQTVGLTNSHPIVISVARDVLPTGIAHFSLLSNKYQPLNERIVFVNHHDQLSISLHTNEQFYSTRDSISVNVKVTDEDGSPVSGNFSVAVTDDSQVKSDSLGVNILNNLLLTSDLKGEVEDPAYYFIENKEAELDNLMLTQGWIGYNWQDILYPRFPLTYQPEKEFIVSGKAINAFGKPIEKSNVILFTNRPVTIRDTVTDNDGKFVFRGLFPVDTAIFKLQARNKRGKEFNVGIEMDVIKPPLFKSIALIKPWFVNTDTTLLSNMRIKTQENNAQAAYRGEGMQLKEVNIRSKKVIRGSKNLNGPGEADQIIDEEELNKADKKTLNDLLKEKIEGFIEQGGIYVKCLACTAVSLAYVKYTKRLHFIFDGMSLDFFYTGGMNRHDFIKSYLDYYTAEDVTGIEVMYNPKYTGAYGTFNDEGGEAYIEITTRSKSGPFMKVTPGTYLYKTLAFTLPKQFYKPKYTATNRDKSPGTDLRSTIHWEPNLMTDASGNATFSFYSADKAANYTFIIEGTDLNGQLGYTTGKIKVK